MHAAHLTTRTLIAAALMAGCSDAPTAPSVSSRPVAGEPRPIVHLSVTPSSAVIRTGQSLRLTAVPSGQPADVAARLTVSWESENEEVASVSEDGAVRGGRPGETRIRARYGTAFASATVTVLKSSTPAAPCMSTIPKSDGC